jgi:hypothetical protein
MGELDYTAHFSQGFITVHAFLEEPGNHVCLFCVG